MASVVRAPREASAAYAYYVLFVLALVYMFSSVDRTLISVLAEPIKREFALSDGQLGLLTGLAFAISYSIAGIPLGLLADRLQRTRLLSGLVAIWSGLTFLSGMASSAFTLALARVGVGASESGASPASMSLITDYFPKERRGLAMALFYMSTPIGVSLAFAIGGAVAASFGWRAAFLFAGVPGFLLALIILLSVREARRGRFDGSDASSDCSSYRFRDAAGTLFSIRPLILLLAGAVSVVVAQAGTHSFLSPLFIRFHGLSVREAGSAIAAVTGPAGIIGILLGGVMADWLAKRSTDAGPRVVGFLMLLAAPFAVAAMYVSSLTGAIALVACYTFLNYTYYGAIFATFMTIAPVRMRGALAGMFAVSMTLFGYGLGPPLAGLSSDLFLSLGVAEPLRYALMVTASFYGVAGLLFLFAAGAIRRMDAAPAPDATEAAIR